DADGELAGGSAGWMICRHEFKGPRFAAPAQRSDTAGWGARSGAKQQASGARSGTNIAGSGARSRDDTAGARGRAGSARLGRPRRADRGRGAGARANETGLNRGPIEPEKRGESSASPARNRGQRGPFSKNRRGRDQPQIGPSSGRHRSSGQAPPSPAPAHADTVEP